jgi:hypothetical protein
VKGARVWSFRAIGARTSLRRKQCSDLVGREEKKEGCEKAELRKKNHTERLGTFLSSRAKKNASTRSHGRPRISLCRRPLCRRREKRTRSPRLDLDRLRDPSGP